MKLYSLFSAAIIILSPATASAARLGIFVRMIEGDHPTGIDQLALHDRIAGRAEFALDLAVVRASELLTSDVRRSVIDCGEDLDCIAGKLRAAEIELGVLATIDASSDPALILVILVDAKTGERVGRILDENARDDVQTIARLAEESALRLLRSAGHSLGGRIFLSVEPGDAAVLLRHASTPTPIAGKAGEKMTLASGKWIAEISKPGFYPKTIELKVTTGKDTAANVTLENESGALSSPWLWIGLGAAVVAGAVAAAVIFNDGGPRPSPIGGDDGRVIETLSPSR